MKTLAPHIPTGAQLSQLKTLQTTSITAAATLATAQTTLATAQTALQQAKANEKQYEAYIYGSAMKGGVDEGNPNNV